MGVVAKVGKRIADMGFNASGGVVNWFPGHMAAATRAIRDRLKIADLVVEVRDARREAVFNWENKKKRPCKQVPTTCSTVKLWALKMQ